MNFLFNLILFSGSSLGAVCYVDYSAELAAGILLATGLILHLIIKIESFLEKIKND